MPFKVQQTIGDTILKSLRTRFKSLARARSVAETLYRREGVSVRIVDLATGQTVYRRRLDDQYLFGNPHAQRP